MKKSKRKLLKLGKQVLKELAAQLKEIAFGVFGWSVEDWAQEAEVSASTIYNLIGGVTRFVQLETVIRLADPLGWDVVGMDREKMTLELKEPGGRSRRKRQAA